MTSLRTELVMRTESYLIALLAVVSFRFLLRGAVGRSPEKRRAQTRAWTHVPKGFSFPRGFGDAFAWHIRRNGWLG